jgi:hypothetical protein
MNSKQLLESIKTSLISDVDGVTDAKDAKKGLRVVMDDGALFLVQVTRLDEDEEEDDEDEDDEEYDDEDEDDEEYDDDEEELDVEQGK